MSNRPNILKLASKISLESLTYTGITFKDPEYRILDPIVDDDMCSVMLHMKLDTPRTTEDIARRCGKDPAWTLEQLKKLQAAGVIRIMAMKDAPAQEGWYYPIWVPGIMEGILSNREQCDRYPDIGKCFEEYTRLRVAMLAPLANSGKAGMFFMRVMPVNSAVENISKTAAYDEVRTLIEKATAISVGPCSCRRSRRLIGEGCGHLEDDMCIYLNDNAVNFSRLGYHRLITKEEAYEVLRRAEDNGLVHEINQTPGFEDATAICNCCGCSCYALRVAEMFRSKNAIRSNYVARIDKNKCVACGQCVENCQTNALRLGQKNSAVDPHISDAYDSDRAVPYDAKSYVPDYRTARSDVMSSGTSPCKAACPAHIAVQGYIKLAGEGRYAEALDLIRKENPFPAVCGRICNKRCEEACTRNIVDDAVAIDDIKKFIAEKELDASIRAMPKMLNTTGRPYTEKIAVIGAGPAGLSCAYYLALKGYPVTVFEKEAVPGGMLTLGIPSFRLDKDVVNAEIDILRDLGVDIRCGVEVGKDITIASLREEGYRAFYLAIGASAAAAIGCKGDKLPGVYSGLDFLKAVNSGERPDLGKNVIVIGGGNVAIDVARSAIRLTDGTVTVLYRRSRAEMPAAEEEIREAEEEGVQFRFAAAPAEISGNGKVEELTFELMAPGEKDAKGRTSYNGTGKYEIIPASTVIGAVGQKIVPIKEPVRTGIKGNVIASTKTWQTSVPDVFAGGDVVTGPKFAIDAIAAGKEAAVSIHRFVHEGQSQTIGRDPRDYKPLDVSTVSVTPSGFDNTPRQHAAAVDGTAARATFKDLRGELTEAQIQKEAARCMGCGCAVIDEDLCVGCGICTTKCRFDAIRLEKTIDNVGNTYYKTLLTCVGNVPSVASRFVRKKTAKK